MLFMQQEGKDAAALNEPMGRMLLKKIANQYKESVLNTMDYLYRGCI
jgi:hypothetical protein